eukprot:954438_1
MIGIIYATIIGTTSSNNSKRDNISNPLLKTTAKTLLIALYSRGSIETENAQKNREIRAKMYFIEGNDGYHSLEVITQQLCDCIHDWVFHSPIIPLITKAASQQMLNDEQKPDANNINDTMEIDSDEDWDFDASDVKLLRSLKSNQKKANNTNEARKKAIGKLQNGDKYLQHSKFVTNTTDFEENNHKNVNNKFNTVIDDEEQKTDAIHANTAMMSSVGASPSYEFGIEMMYSEQYQQYARHKSIRDEVLNNQNKKYTLTMDQWEDTVTKSKHYVNCATGKRVKATITDGGLNIKIDDPLTHDALIACLLYTNFTDLQRKFSSSTRRYSHQQNKTDKDIRTDPNEHALCDENGKVTEDYEREKLDFMISHQLDAVALMMHRIREAWRLRIQ